METPSTRPRRLCVEASSIANSCEQCGQPCSSLTQLNEHVRKMHGVCATVCSVCWCEFKSMARYEAHLPCHAKRLSNGGRTPKRQQTPPKTAPSKRLLSKSLNRSGTGPKTPVSESATERKPKAPDRHLSTKTVEQIEPTATQVESPPPLLPSAYLQKSTIASAAVGEVANQVVNSPANETFEPPSSPPPLQSSPSAIAELEARQQSAHTVYICRLCDEDDSFEGHLSSLMAHHLIDYHRVEGEETDLYKDLYTKVCSKCKGEISDTLCKHLLNDCPASQKIKMEIKSEPVED